MKKRYTIDNEDILFVKGYGYTLIRNPDRPDGTLKYCEYFIINDDLFDRILAMDQNSDNALNINFKDVLLA